MAYPLENALFQWEEGYRELVDSINTNATVATTAAIVPIGTITTQPTFLPTSTLLEARILQFGLKVDF